MDALATEIEDGTISADHTGNTYLRAAVVGIAFILLVAATPVSAQSARIRTQKSTTSLVHSLKTESQDFPPSVWLLQNSFRDGCVVRVSAEPFAHTTVIDAQVNCRLSARLRDASRGARWEVTQARDTSRFATKKDAFVTVTSQRPGAAKLEILLEFDAVDPAQIAAGTYQTTVTGTITGL